MVHSLESSCHLDPFGSPYLKPKDAGDTVPWPFMSEVWPQADGAPCVRAGLSSVLLTITSPWGQIRPRRALLLAGLPAFMDHDPDSCHAGSFRGLGSYEGSDSLGRSPVEAGPLGSALVALSGSDFIVWDV